MKLESILGLVVSGLLVGPDVFGGSFTVSYYRLGEADPGAIAGQAVSPFTVDEGGRGARLERGGKTPVYSPATGVEGSSVSVEFNGGGFTNAMPMVIADNWGIEAWVRAARKVPSLSTDGHAVVVYSGDSGANGIGILQAPDGSFKGLCGGVGFVGSATVVTGRWTHLAVVVSDGKSTFYANGRAAGTGPVPRGAGDIFGVGLNPRNYGNGEPFQGNIDEVRVFAFGPGQFSTNDLLLARVPPPPQAPLVLGGPIVSPAGVILSGSSFSLTVSAAGTGPFTFQWRINGEELEGATNTSLTFASATVENSGDYSVVVANQYGSVTSASVRVNIGTPAEALTNAMRFLEAKAREMIRADRHVMPNGVAAFPPQVGSGYDAFWLRDYAYMLEGAAAEFTTKELTEACELFVKSIRGDGAGVDCVRYSGQPIYKPGYGTMGENPVADGSQFTVDVAWHTYQQTKDRAFLETIIEGLVKTMNAAPRNPTNGLVHIKPGGWDRCPYGFTDSVRQQGDLLFCSLLYIQACCQLADLLAVLERDEEASQWREKAVKVTASVRQTFWDERIGLFRAATVYCGQPDIWGSAFAVWLGVATPEQSVTIARYFQEHYGELVQTGQIRHLPGGMYWDAACPRDTYQNGAFWATATGWFVYTLNLIDPELANRTLIELVSDFQARGVNEWVFGATLGVNQYLTSVTMPLAGARRMISERGLGPQVIIGPTISPESRVQSGSGFALSVLATGESPLTFHWRRAGIPVSASGDASVSVTNYTLNGSTVASIMFSNVTEAAAGRYEVVVTNASGSVTSSAVNVTVAAPRTASTIQRSGTEIIVVWSGPALEEADTPFGPWSTITNPAIPWITSATGRSRFFRAAQD